MNEGSMMRLYQQGLTISRHLDQKQNVDHEVLVDDEVFKDLSLNKQNDLC